MGYKQASGLAWFKETVGEATYEDGDEKKAVKVMQVDPEPAFCSEESGSDSSDREESESESPEALSPHPEDFNQAFEPESPEAETPPAVDPEADNA